MWSAPCYRSAKFYYHHPYLCGPLPATGARTFTITTTTCVVHPLQVLEGPVYRVPADTTHPLTVRLIFNESLAEDVLFLRVLESNQQELNVTPRTEFEWQLYFVSTELSSITLLAR